MWRCPLFHKYRSTRAMEYTGHWPSRVFLRPPIDGILLCHHHQPSRMHFLSLLADSWRASSRHILLKSTGFKGPVRIDILNLRRLASRQRRILALSRPCFNSMSSRRSKKSGSSYYPTTWSEWEWDGGHQRYQKYWLRGPNKLDFYDGRCFLTFDNGKAIGNMSTRRWTIYQKERWRSRKRINTWNQPESRLRTRENGNYTAQGIVRAMSKPKLKMDWYLVTGTENWLVGR